MWRRKLFILICSLLFLIGIWAWAIYYTTYTSNGSSNDGTNKIMTVREFDGERDRIIAKYGIIGEHFERQEIVQFVKPTIQPKIYNRNADSSLRLRERFQSFSSFFLNKDAEKVLENFEVPLRNKSGHQKDAERLHFAAERQSQYERDLHRMVIKFGLIKFIIQNLITA